MSEVNDRLVNILSTLLTPEGQESLRRDGAVSTIQEIITRVLGRDGVYWLYNLKRFLRKEPCFKWSHAHESRSIFVRVPDMCIGQKAVPSFKVVIVHFNTHDFTPPRYEWNDLATWHGTPLNTDEVAALTSYISPSEFYDMGLHWLCHTFYARGEGGEECLVNRKQVVHYSHLVRGSCVEVQASQRTPEQSGHVILTGPGGYAFKVP